jgi:hypothetical protein
VTDEEMSELAECLQDACEDAQRVGMRLVPQSFGLPTNGDCPLGAATGYRYPFAHDAARYLQIEQAVAFGFVRGFDGATNPSNGDWRAFNLGRLFREQYK